MPDKPKDQEPQEEETTEAQIQPNPEEWAKKLAEQEVTPEPENTQIYHDPEWKPAEDPTTEADEKNDS
jgi:hypothetical protein